MRNSLPFRIALRLIPSQYLLNWVIDQKPTADPMQRHSVATWCAFFVVASGALAWVQSQVGATTSDLSMSADEAAHFVNSLLIRDYLLGAFGRNPMSFALDYYAHVPRVSIGHWPPLYYLVQGLLVSSWDRSIAAAIKFQSVIAGALGAT